MSKSNRILMATIATGLFSLSLEAAASSQSAYQTPWARHTITAVSIGADGVDLRDINGDGLLDVTTPWEQGGIVTVSYHPAVGSDPREPWPTTVIATHVAGVEDSKFADIDGDGKVDVVSASDGGQRLYIHFSGETWTTVTIASSLGHHQWMQVSSADIDGDGNLDIVAGSRGGTAANPAVIAWFKNPGPEAARDGATWTFHEMTKAGWAMSVFNIDVDGDGDLDTVVTDRSSFRNPDNTVSWGLYGARWIETKRLEGGLPEFENHPIEVAGNCSTCTPGDEMFGTLYDFDGDGSLDLIDGQSSSTRSNRIVVHQNLAGWGPPTTWSQEFVPGGTGVGHFQGAAVGDIDGDGLPDIVVSTWESDVRPSSPSLTGIYWMRNLGNGNWEQEELSGIEGTKFDNVVLYDVDGDGDLDVVDSEQVDELGVVWYENPGFSTPFR